VKLNLIAPILDVLFPVICDLSADEEEDTDAVDVDAQKPSSLALQVCLLPFQRPFLQVNPGKTVPECLHSGF